MKKFIAIIAAIALIATMSVSVFAADATLTDVAPKVASASSPVKATYKDAGAEKVNEIHLDVTWTDVDFEYTASDKAWNEDTMKWEDTDGEWTDAAAKVTVSSRSSVAVVVKAAYTPNGVNASFDNTSLNLAAADGAAVPGEFNLTVDADPAQSITATNENAGTITITIEGLTA